MSWSMTNSRFREVNIGCSLRGALGGFLPAVFEEVQSPSPSCDRVGRV